MSEASIRQRVAAYYTSKVRRHGTTARGVDWNGEASQHTRFVELMRLLPQPGDAISVLDYGCGYGALVEHLRRRGGPFRYLGFDLSAEMIRRARELYPEPECRFARREEDLEPQDYVLASGVFNVKLDVPAARWSRYLLATLDRLDELSVRGFAFNALSTYSDPERRRDDLYYADPRRLFDRCKRRYSRQVALLHDYGLWECTLLVRKDLE